MAATLAQMRTRVKIMVGGKAGIDDTIDGNINEAILQLIQEVRPQEVTTSTTFAAAASTAEYTFSSSPISVTDLLAVVMVRDNTKDWEIKRGGKREYNRFPQDTSVAGNLGDPHRWTRIGNKLILYNKIPNSLTRTIELTYLKRPATMTSVVNFPLNEEWRKPVERLAASMTWADLSKMDLSSFHASVYREMIAIRQNPEAIEDEAPEAQMIPISNLVDNAF